MIDVNFNSKKGILESRWKGDVNLEEIVNYIHQTKEQSEYPRRLKIITYAHEATLQLKPSDLNRIVEENTRSLANYEVIMDAFIANEAQVAALSTLYEKFSRMKDYRFKVFSTEDAALEWLLDN